MCTTLSPQYVNGMEGEPVIRLEEHLHEKSSIHDNPDNLEKV